MKRLTIAQKVVQNVTECGPARRSYLADYAERHGAMNGSMVIDGLLGAGELVLIGWARGARLGTPQQAKELASAKPRKTRVIQG